MATQALKASINDLPVEIEIQILSQLPAKQVQRMRQVSRHYLKVIKNKSNRDQIIKPIRARHISKLEEQIEECLQLREKNFYESLIGFLEYRGLTLLDAVNLQARTDSVGFVHFWLSSRKTPGEHTLGRTKSALHVVAKVLIWKYVIERLPISISKERKTRCQGAVKGLLGAFDKAQAGQMPELAQMLRFGVGKAQVLGWLSMIENKTGPSLKESAMVDGHRTIESWRNLACQTCPEPIQIFSETVNFPWGQVFRLRKTHLPDGFEFQSGRYLLRDACHEAKILSLSLNRLYGVPVFDVCRSVPYSVGNTWACDCILNQLAGFIELDDLKQTALVEELFIDPRASVETALLAKANVWISNRPQSRKVQPQEDPVVAVDDVEAFPPLGGGR